MHIITEMDWRGSESGEMNLPVLISLLALNALCLNALCLIIGLRVGWQWGWDSRGEIDKKPNATLVHPILGGGD